MPYFLSLHLSLTYCFQELPNGMNLQGNMKDKWSLTAFVMISLDNMRQKMTDIV